MTRLLQRGVTVDNIAEIEGCTRQNIASKMHCKRLQHCNNGGFVTGDVTA